MQFRFLGSIVLSLSAGAALAAPQDELRQFVTQVQSLSASFEQVQRDEKGETLQRSSGRLWLARPGKFRWSYEKPYQQLMVCDGDTLWLYDPDLSQVTVRPAAGTLQGTPAQLLTDPAALDRHFKIEPAGDHLKLLPKTKDSDFSLVELWLKDGAPARMRFHDPFGGASEVTFGDVKRNVKVDAAQFKFEIPKGAEVIEARDRPKK